MKYRLSIFDIMTGTYRPILVTSKLIEAPNWHPEGYFLLNAEGQLYRVDPNDPKLEPFPIDYLLHFNNDPGITPYGKTVIVSNSPTQHSSVIYMVQVKGGVPKRATHHGPSWWHGVSPDGSKLVYTAQRDGIFDIYTCPIEGGDERKLTTDFDHTDGPDYTADGDWIWFNGARAGSMDLWRMRKDGSDLERMTNDQNDGWFPHPSLDGKSILYLTYAAGTEGHPRNKHVELRLLSLDDRNSLKLPSLYGGEGTIIVPSWNKKGTHFAFVDVLQCA